jgi:hypothetical protein
VTCGRRWHSRLSVDIQQRTRVVLGVSRVGCGGQISRRVAGRFRATNEGWVDFSPFSVDVADLN